MNGPRRWAEGVDQEEAAGQGGALGDGGNVEKAA
jgi:hypothetical protein